MNIKIESDQFMEGQENPPGTIRAYPTHVGMQKCSINLDNAIYLLQKHL